MLLANRPDNEQERVHNLYSYELLDSLPEKDYDEITRLASFICDTPISLVTLIDDNRQWFKSAHGTSLRQTTREEAFCSHAILKPNEIMIVKDAEKDERFFDNPLVTGDQHIAFYAGVPLITEEGYPIGSLCVLDRKPNDLSNGQQQALQTLASQTMRLMQLHKKAAELAHSRKLLQEMNNELENFAQVTAEKIIAPCENAIEFTDIITEKFADNIDVDGRQLLSLVKYSCESVKTTVTTIRKRTGIISVLQEAKAVFTFTTLLQDVKKELAGTAAPLVIVDGKGENDALFFYKNSLRQILVNIISTSAQFNEKEDRNIKIAFRPDKDGYMFTLTDNGKGIPVFSRNGEFALLQPAGNEDDSHYTDNLNAVKKMITVLSGSLEMRFDENVGTIFTVTLPK